MKNILITGTPSTGKTATCDLLAEETGMNYINIGDWVKEKGLHEGRDEEMDCFVLDEDKLLDALEETMQKKGNIVEFHGSDFFPERWFDLVVVLRTDNSILYSRLEKKGYSEGKIKENIECEIMQICLEEARDSYKPEIIMELQSNEMDDLLNNIETIKNFISSH